MIIAEIFAGLGNQMFQYAAARAVAEKLGVPLKLNIFSYERNTLYPFDLDKFNITAAIANKKEVERAVSLPSNLLIRSHLLLMEKFKLKILKRSIIREEEFHYEDKLLYATKNTYIFGHWQSERYFKKCQNIIREEFSLTKEAIEDRTELIQKIEHSNSVSLTIRRGDYLQHHHLNLYGEQLTFHHQAVKYIAERISQPHFFVFSDDIEWVKKNLQLTFPVTYVSDVYSGDAYKLNPKRHQDLLLMSKCKHHITTNSTFAWWGAWLNPSKNKIVVAPKQWFREGTKWYNGEPVDTKDLIPEDWIKL